MLLFSLNFFRRQNFLFLKKQTLKATQYVRKGFLLLFFSQIEIFSLNAISAFFTVLFVFFTFFVIHFVFFLSFSLKTLYIPKRLL